MKSLLSIVSDAHKFYLARIEKTPVAMGVNGIKNDTYAPRSEATATDAGMSIAEIYALVKESTLLSLQRTHTCATTCSIAGLRLNMKKRPIAS